MKKPSSRWHLVLLTFMAVLSLSAESFSMPTSASVADQPHALVSYDDETASSATAPESLHSQLGLAFVPQLPWAASSQRQQGLISRDLPQFKKLETLHGTRWHRWLCVERC